VISARICPRVKCRQRQRMLVLVGQKFVSESLDSPLANVGGRDFNFRDEL